VSLIKSGPVLTGLKDHLTAVLPSRLKPAVDPDASPDGTVAITPVSGPTLQYFAMAGPDKARMLVQITVADSTRERVRLAADLIRDAIAGVDHRNRPLHPLALPGYTFDVPTTTGDGHALTESGKHSWVETFALVWQHRSE